MSMANEFISSSSGGTVRGIHDSLIVKRIQPLTNLRVLSEFNKSGVDLCQAIAVKALAKLLV